MSHAKQSMICYRPGGKADAREIAELMNIAGEGIPMVLWADAAPGDRDPMDTGTRKAAREDASFSYRNTRVAAAGGRIAGMVLAYRLPEPSPRDIDGLSGLPALVRPMVELEHEVGGSFYVNALAVRNGFRGRGVGTRLLRMVTPHARHAGCSLMSVGVFSENTGALRLYRREGFEVVGERPVAAHPCYTRGDRTLMLVKPV